MCFFTPHNRKFRVTTRNFLLCVKFEFLIDFSYESEQIYFPANQKHVGVISTWIPILDSTRPREEKTYSGL